MFIRKIKRFDLYGKEPEFYYKNNSNKTTLVGRIFTYLYLGVYIAFFVYKIERMARRRDVTFYDTNSNRGETPSIHLNKEIFNAALAFDNPITNIPFINNRIYIISGKYITQTRENEKIITNEYDISFKKCEVSDFGKNYQNIMAKKNISQMLCPSHVDFVLEGYYTMEKYSYIKVNFQRCVNTTENNNHCYPNETIDEILAITKIDTKLQDIELTPQDYDNPVRYLEREISGTSFKGLMPQISVEMKVVIVETDNNIIGFEGLSNLKIDKYLKYDSKTINAIPITSVYGIAGASNNLNEIIIQLSSNILYQKRTYVKLIDILGDVGGLMEIINMIFSGICYLIVNILYNKSLVNNLFNFDLNKKLVILKSKNNNKIIDIDININNKILPQKNNVDKKENNKIKKKIVKMKIKKRLYFPQAKPDGYERNNKSSRRSLNDNFEYKIDDRYIHHISTIAEHNGDEKKPKEEIHNDNQINQINHLDNNLENEKIFIKKIQANKLFFYFYFCCLNNRQNINNILFIEGIKLIKEQLDIFNIFRRLYELSKSSLILTNEDITVQMSDECKQKVGRIINKNLLV